MSVSFDFTDKVVLITGSSSGIGAATAVQFAKSGAKVVVTGRNEEHVAEVAQQCQEVSPNGQNALQVVADLNNEEELRLLVDRTIDEFGRLDVLVNNAGFGKIMDILDPNYVEEFKSVLDTNLTAVVSLTHMCIEHLSLTKGNIVNNSSVASNIAWKQNSAYSMSKCALDMFTKCAAIELGHLGIRVNSVNPGIVHTHIFETAGLSTESTDYFLNLFANKYPVGRVGDPDEVAAAILFLASDQSAFTTGTNMIIDGGHTAANVTVYSE